MLADTAALDEATVTFVSRSASINDFCSIPLVTMTAKYMMLDQWHPSRLVPSSFLSPGERNSSSRAC